MKWVGELNFSEFELEKRIHAVLKYFYDIDTNCICYISQSDTIGNKGNLLTQKLNDNKT